jgi:hypothetical protein
MIHYQIQWPNLFVELEVPMIGEKWRLVADEPVGIEK